MYTNSIINRVLFCLGSNSKVLCGLISWLSETIFLPIPLHFTVVALEIIHSSFRKKYIMTAEKNMSMKIILNRVFFFKVLHMNHNNNPNPNDITLNYPLPNDPLTFFSSVFTPPTTQNHFPAPSTKKHDKKRPKHRLFHLKSKQWPQYRKAHSRVAKQSQSPQIYPKIPKSKTTFSLSLRSVFHFAICFRYSFYFSFKNCIFLEVCIKFYCYFFWNVTKSYRMYFVISYIAWNVLPH